MHLNLLPIGFRIRLILRAQLRNWTRLWGLCLLVVLGVCGIEAWQVYDWRGQVEHIHARSRPVRALQRTTDDLRQQLTRLRAETERTENIQPSDRMLPLLGILGESVEKIGGQVQVVRLTVHATSQRPSAASKATAKRGSATAAAAIASTLSIQGVATDDESLSRFVSALRSYGVFERVDLKSSNRLAAAAEGGREFQLECGFL